MRPIEFLHEARFSDLPPEIVVMAKRCLSDLLGVMAAGSQTKLTRLISRHATSQFAAGDKSASILFNGASVSPAGAALVNGMMIDSIDAHDGFRPAKGHVGCHVLPTLFAFYEMLGRNEGTEFLTDLVVGYEFGCRAAIALHATAPDYHTSGAWGAVTSAALGSRILGLDYAATRHAIGIGEYHGPRSQMMRVIDHPTMLKDGSGWGAMAGVSAALLAQDGFTGAPAVTVEGDDVSQIWNNIGSEWLIMEQYFKPYPVCRWAQPATAAALTLAKDNSIEPDTIEKIEVFSFHEACRLAIREPIDTEQAQYSLPFPVAAALVFGKIGPKEIDGDSLSNERVLALSRSMQLSEIDAYNEAFPGARYSHVAIILNDGTRLVSDRHQAEGDPETPLSDAEIKTKFHSLADPVLGEARSSRIRNCIERLGKTASVSDLPAELGPPA